MRPKAVLAPILILLTLGLAACGGGSDGDTNTADTAETETTTGTTLEEPSGNAPAPSGEAPRSAKIRIVGFSFDPDTVTIQAGGKVTWLNEDSAPHTATADEGSFDTGTIQEGKIKSEAFKEPGTYGYFCEIHPEMRGTVEVVEKD
jgi:plastocyanin